MVNGLVYIADTNNNVIRVVNQSSNIITKFAGNYANGKTGDGGRAVNALLYNPVDVAVDPIRNLVYIADSGNSFIRVVNISTGNITRFAGGGTSGNNGLSTSYVCNINLF
jgi:DNA-binding beta-propeller fold protein YncE